MLLFFVSKIRLIANTESNYEDNKVDIVNMVKQNYNKNKTICKIYWKTPASFFINRSCRFAKFFQNTCERLLPKAEKAGLFIQTPLLLTKQMLSTSNSTFSDFESVFGCTFDYESALGICMACPPKKVICVMLSTLLLESKVWFLLKIQLVEKSNKYVEISWYRHTSFNCPRLYKRIIC